jgi:hypothetical protein
LEERKLEQKKKGICSICFQTTICALHKGFYIVGEKFWPPKKKTLIIIPPYIWAFSKIFFTSRKMNGVIKHEN